MVINYEELFRPYSKDGHTLENSIRYLKKVATQQGVKPEFVNIAVETIFMEVASGREFSLNKCPCGCGLDRAGTAIIHAMRDRMFEIDRHYQTRFREWLNEEHNKSIIEHIEIQNKSYVAMVLPEEAPIGFFKRIYRFLNKPRLTPKHWRYK